MSTSLLSTAGLLLAAAAPNAVADDTTQAINKLLADAWKAKDLKPSERTNDAEFVRRVYLDIVGRIPRVEEVQTFEKDTAADKRAKLIEKLLDSPEYTQNWSRIWTLWLVGRGAPSLQQAQMHIWLDEQLGTKDSTYRDLVVKLLTATGKNNENGGTNFLLTNVGKSTSPQSANPKQTEEILEREGQYNMVPATVRTARLFLGYRLDGLDVPDHRPENSDWTATDFWQFNIFFRQVVREGLPPTAPSKVLAPLTLKDNTESNKKGVLYIPQPNGGAAQRVEGIFLDGRKLRDGKGSRREILAEYVTSHDNFPKAYVNRMWGHFFGRGLNEKPAVDDFGSQNKVIHPELLDRLAKDFAAGGHDPKKLIRWICNSDAYQLKSAGNETNTKTEAERYFSRMPLKLLSPEQVSRSLAVLVQPQAKGELTAESKLGVQLRRSLYGRTEEPDWEDLAFHDKVIQAMAFVNRREVGDIVLDSSSNPLARAAEEQDPLKGLEVLYLAALSRKPTERDVNQVQPEIKKANGDKELHALWQDLLWALVNSSEFMLNH